MYLAQAGRPIAALQLSNGSLPAVEVRGESEVEC